MPIEAVGPRIPIYTQEFAADPHRFYRAMREGYRSLVPVEIWAGVPATLVIGYHTAVRILGDTHRFPPIHAAGKRPYLLICRSCR